MLPAISVQIPSNCLCRRVVGYKFLHSQRCASSGDYGLEPLVKVSPDDGTTQDIVARAVACVTSRASNSMRRKSADSPWMPPGAASPSPSSRDCGRHSHDRHVIDRGERWDGQRSQFRDDGARAMRAVFSSHDNWLDLSEAERDEWRGYFDRMLEGLRHLGYTPERNPWSMLLQDLTLGADPSDEGAS
jgi:hypothetical protein